MKTAPAKPAVSGAGISTIKDAFKAEPVKMMLIFGILSPGLIVVILLIARGLLRSLTAVHWPWFWICVSVLVIALAITAWMKKGWRKGIGAVLLAVAAIAVVWIGIKLIRSTKPSVPVVYKVMPDPQTRTVDLLVTKEGSDTLSIPLYYVADWVPETEVTYDALTFPRGSAVAHVTRVPKHTDKCMPLIKGPNDRVAFRIHGDEPIHFRVYIRQHHDQCPSTDI